MEAVASIVSDSRVVAKLLKRVISPHFAVPRVLISDNGTYFIEKKLEALLKKYGVQHKYGLCYHPQINGQVKISCQEIKSILKKAVVRSGKN